MKPMDARVTEAIAIMQRRREHPISVAELAHLVNVSPSYLTRLFKKATGTSPGDYDRARRLDYAYERVTSSLLSIKEIMAAAGWNDPSHFSRDFRRRFGISPMRLRKGFAADRAHGGDDAAPPMEAWNDQERSEARGSRSPYGED
jgi:transcriptional regulator GlxA family with amidase domain